VELRFTGFWRNNIAQSRLKGEVMKLLISADFVKLPGMFERRNELTSRIMETARRKTELLSA
jgi:type I restriction enzyme R subunit